MKEIFGNNPRLDERSVDFLAKALETGNLPGFDYLEFKISVVGLMKLGLVEAIAFKSAFTTAATLGFSKEKLVETVGFYRNLIEKEAVSFDEALATQQAQKIETRKTEIARFQDQLNRNKAEITRLQDELAKYLTEIEASESAILTETDKLTRGKTAFHLAHQHVLTVLDGDLERIHAFISE